MSIGGIIYKLIIGPLELLFEVVFVIATKLVSHPAYAIIVLSLVMNILVLPLYKRADAIQEEERERAKRMRPWIDHIKRTFKGDERFMMLQTYYRQNDYKPTQVFRGSISLFLEIPFFIAAFHFLSNLEMIKGVSFGPIADLGAPDALISIGGMSVNVLPILMTLINVISAAVYMKGFPLSSKIQTYGIAAIFLVLLYNAPAGLAFYWTLNNIFSLGKNIVMKSSATSKEESESPLANSGKGLAKPANALFWPSAAMLTVLSGLLCPSAVISDSTVEFVDQVTYFSPFWYIVSAFLLAAGTFLIWLGIFYIISSEKWKGIIAVCTAIAAVTGLADYMFFSNGFGDLSPELVYDTSPQISVKIKLINLAVIMAIVCAAVILWKYRSGVLTSAIVISCISLLVMSGINLAGISKDLKVEKAKAESQSDEEPQFNFSKTGRNVVVIMMDRMVGSYIPYIMNEKPELKEQFSGFTYYSNVVSYATTTNEGLPPIFGGYDYTPENMNARDDELLADKHDEALKMMPELFGNAGFDVTICNPTYAGYQWDPDLSIYDDHPEYHTYMLNRRFSLEEYGYYAAGREAVTDRMRNFYCYSIFRMAPMLIEKPLYQSGTYNSSDVESKDSRQFIEGWSKAHGYNRPFMANYAIMNNFSAISNFNEGGQDCFLVLTNDTTHESMLLQEPDYVPAIEVDNTKYDAERQTREDGRGNTIEFETKHHMTTYHVNVAAMIKLGEWFDYLRENGVYDNTRIIVVSDHGSNYKEATNDDYAIRFKDEDTGKNQAVDIRRFDCTLMYKDFDAKEFTELDAFTTNADTPALALEGIVDSPTNPFTGNPITTFDESKRPVYVARTKNHKINVNNGTQFIKSWTFEVDNNAHRADGWKYVGNR